MGVLVHFSISTKKEFFVLSNLEVFIILISILSKEFFILSNSEVCHVAVSGALHLIFLILFCNFQKLPGLCLHTLSMTVQVIKKIITQSKASIFFFPFLNYLLDLLLNGFAWDLCN